MGHTIYPMRWVIYDKMAELNKLLKALREPERQIAKEMLQTVFENISTITYANPLPSSVEDNMIFTILIQEKLKGDVSIDDLTLYIFSLLIMYKTNKIQNPNESDIYRLLCAR